MNAAKPAGREAVRLFDRLEPPPANVPWRSAKMRKRDEDADGRTVAPITPEAFGSAASKDVAKQALTQCVKDG